MLRLGSAVRRADATASLAGCASLFSGDARQVNDSSTSQDATSGAVKRGMTTGAKVGLGMLPAVICLVTALVVFMVWLRRRRAQNANYPQNPPPVPEKDYPMRGRSGDRSAEGNHRGSRVFNMAAFTTPINYTHKREASIIGQSPTRKSAFQREKGQGDMKTVRLAIPESLYVDRDSPVDGSSPFRLKRGDTMKRLSLGSEISKVWPSPPPAVWIRQPNVPERTVSPLQMQERSRPSAPYKARDTEAEIIGLYSRL